MNNQQPASFGDLASSLPFTHMTQAVFIFWLTNAPASFHTVSALLPFSYMTQALVGERFF